MEIKIVLRSRRLWLKFQIDSIISYYNCYLCGEKGGSRNKNAKIDEPEQRRSEIFVDTIQDLLCKLGIKSVDINIFHYTIRPNLPESGMVPTKIGHIFRK